MKPKDWIVHMCLLNCDDFLDHFSWNVEKTKYKANK